MSIELLTIGREILDGRVVDTNSVFFGEELAKIGLVPRHAQRVDDERDRILEAFELATRRADIVLVTGGLGPTSDDLTAEVFAKFLGEPLVMNPVALAHVEGILTRLGRPVTDVQRKQALLPPSAQILANPEGTAPGFYGTRGTTQFYFMPGVPREMKRMFREQVLPKLPARASYESYTWATQFTSEGELQRQLNEIEPDLKPWGFEITYRTRFPENHIGLHGDCLTSESRHAFEKLKGRITQTLGDDVYFAGRDLKNLEDVVVEKLVAAKIQVASVESCTGGLVAHRLTNVAGSSQTFFGSWVCYDNLAKIRLGVDSSVIEAHGAVSEATARAMAESGLRVLAQSGVAHGMCVSTTGIAGPTGGTAEKPVGLCHLALAQTGRPTLTTKVQGRAGLPRQELKTLFSQKALDLLRHAAITR